jgi:hypothetical protein
LSSPSSFANCAVKRGRSSPILSEPWGHPARSPGGIQVF